VTRRPVLVGAAVLTVVIVGAFVGASRRTAGPPLDPRSTAPDGTRALVELVDRLGGTVEVTEGPPGPEADVALLLEDRFDRGDAAELEAWVRGGGRLVVADPTSALTPPTDGAVSGELSGTCEVAGLGGARRLDVGEARTLQVPTGATGCFSGGAGAFLVVTQSGAGQVVSLGGPAVFTNELLGRADNPVLAAELLAEVPGGGPRVDFLRPVLAGGGDRGLVDLVGTPARAALVQLVVAFLVVVAWRARRLGRPVHEHQPVTIESSELTRAVGRLLESNGHPDRAAAYLRDRARRELSGHLGLSQTATVDAVAAAVCARTSLTDQEARQAVAGPVRTEEDLVAASRLLSRIREELIHDREPIGG
jgi:hypothetical protein